MIPTLFNLKPGPVKWCKRCSHFHRARLDCGHEEQNRVAKSNRIVKRWVVPVGEGKDECKYTVTGFKRYDSIKEDEA